MNLALKNNEIDVALVLTEGIVADIAKNNNPSKLIKFFVSSPLIWGVHVPAQSSLQDIASLQPETFAISRRGSGSQLMAIVMADQQGWNVGKLKFEEVENSQSKYDEEEVDSQMSQEISRYTPSKQQNLIKVESESSEEAEENEKILHHK